LGNLVGFRIGARVGFRVGTLVGLFEVGGIVRRLVGNLVGGITGASVIGVEDGTIVGIIGADVVGTFTGEKGAIVPGGIAVGNTGGGIGDGAVGVMGIAFTHLQTDIINDGRSAQSSSVILPPFPAISNVPQGMFEYFGEGGVKTAFGLPTTIPIPQTLHDGLVCAWLITIYDAVRR
jgi:hypothetical protein